MANRAERRRAQRAGTPIQDGYDLHGIQIPAGPYSGVMIGMPFYGGIDPQTFQSMFTMLAYDARNAGHVIFDGGVSLKGSAFVIEGRNQIARSFLETQCKYLLFIDTDMTFEPDLVERMVETAEKEDLPILGALCFARLHDGDIVPVCTAYRELEGKPKIVRLRNYPRDEVFPCAVTGTGVMLIRRDVLEELFKRWVPPTPWFDVMHWPEGGGDWNCVGEDYTFCLRAASTAGNRPGYVDDGTAPTFLTHVDSRIKCGHRKTFDVDERMFDEQAFVRYNTEAPNFVVVPVKGKHYLTHSLLAQLERQGGYERIYLFDNAYGTAEQFPGTRVPNVSVLPADGLNIHQMWNRGVRLALAERGFCNVAVLNNDLNLGPDFLNGLARALRSNPRLFAVSPNYDGRSFEQDIQQVHGIAAGREDGSGGLAGFAFMVRGEIFDNGFPLFDEDFELWYGDNAFCLEMERVKALYGIVRDTTVEHIGGGSQTAGANGKRLGTPELEAMAARDQERFIAKWTVAKEPAA